MYRALWSWIISVVVTVVVTLATGPKPDSELAGLVYGCTEIPSERELRLTQRPIFWGGGGIGAVLIVLNVIFW